MEKGQTPEKINSYASKTTARLAEEEQLADYFKHKRVPIPGVNKGVVGAQGAPNILRTIHMPNQHASTASSETQRLTHQIEQNRMKYEQTINRLRDEKIAFEEA